MPTGLARDDSNRADGALGTALTRQLWTTTGAAASAASALSLPSVSSATIDAAAVVQTYESDTLPHMWFGDV